MCQKQFWAAPRHINQASFDAALSFGDNGKKPLQFSHKGFPMSVADIPSLPTHIGPESNGMMMTPEEYDSIRDWDKCYRYELIHGVLIVSPPADIGERSPNDFLGHLILGYQESHPNGSVVDGTAPEQEIQIGDNRRRADRAIWIGLGRRVHPLNDVPAIAIEFVSRTSRDRHRDYLVKRREYAEAGVHEYWIIDRFRREMTVFRGMKEEIVVKEEDVYKTPLMPGFELALNRLLAKADEYKSDEE